MITTSLRPGLSLKGRAGMGAFRAFLGSQVVKPPLSPLRSVGVRSGGPAISPVGLQSLPYPPISIAARFLTVDANMSAGSKGLPLKQFFPDTNHQLPLITSEHRNEIIQLIKTKGHIVDDNTLAIDGKEIHRNSSKEGVFEFLRDIICNSDAFKEQVENVMSLIGCSQHNDGMAKEFNSDEVLEACLGRNGVIDDAVLRAILPVLEASFKNSEPSDDQCKLIASILLNTRSNFLYMENPIFAPFMEKILSFITVNPESAKDIMNFGTLMLELIRPGVNSAFVKMCERVFPEINLEDLYETYLELQKQLNQNAKQKEVLKDDYSVVQNELMKKMSEDEKDEKIKSNLNIEKEKFTSAFHDKSNEAALLREKKRVAQHEMLKLLFDKTSQLLAALPRRNQYQAVSDDIQLPSDEVKNQALVQIEQQQRELMSVRDTLVEMGILEPVLSKQKKASDKFDQSKDICLTVESSVEPTSETGYLSFNSFLLDAVRNARSQASSTVENEDYKGSILEDLDRAAKVIPNQDFNLFDLPTDVFCAIINVQPIDISSMMDSSTNFHGKASFLDRLKQVSDALRMDIEYFNVDEKMTYNEMRSYKVKLKRAYLETAKRLFVHNDAGTSSILSSGSGGLSFNELFLSIAEILFYIKNVDVLDTIFELQKRNKNQRAHLQNLNNKVMEMERKNQFSQDIAHQLQTDLDRLKKQHEYDKKVLMDNIGADISFLGAGLTELQHRHDRQVKELIDLVLDKSKK